MLTTKNWQPVHIVNWPQLCTSHVRMCIHSESVLQGPQCYCSRCTHGTHIHTISDPQHQTQDMYRTQGDHLQPISEVLTSVSVKMWPHVMWHMLYQNGVIHLPKYGVTSHKTDYLWVLTFLWWHHFRFWLSVMWCCIIGWVAPERNMFLQNIGSLGSLNGMESHPRRMEYLRNVPFMYKLPAYYWCIAAWIFTMYVPWRVINLPNLPSTQQILSSRIHANIHTVLETGMICFQGRSLIIQHPNLLQLLLHIHIF